jgi:hypothetical protein
MDQLIEIPENHLSEEPMLESLPARAPKNRGRPEGSVTKPKLTVVTQTEPVEPLDMNALSMALAGHLSSEKRQATCRRHAHWDGFF